MYIHIHKYPLHMILEETYCSTEEIVSTYAIEGISTSSIMYQTRKNAVVGFNFEVQKIAFQIQKLLFILCRSNRRNIIEQHKNMHPVGL